MNCKHLNDPEYIKLIQDTIIETDDLNPGTEPTLLWDTIKCKIRGASISYSSKINRQRCNLLGELENKLQQLEDDYIVLQDEITLNKIDKVKKHIESIIQEKTEGAMMLCKTRWFMDGEKLSKYFLNLEKRLYNKKVISKLQVSDDKIITDPKEILEEEQKFYTKLYTSPDNFNKEEYNEQYIDFFPENHNHIKISEEQKTFCDLDITEDQLKN